MTDILVLGAGGQLGRDLVRVLERAGYNVVGKTRDQLDVTDRLATRRAIRDVGAEVVIDCAAPSADDPEGQAGGHPAELYRTSARNSAAGARGVGAFSIYLSCAEVFAGEQDTPYVESDQPSPLTGHGAAKLEAEQAVAGANPRHAIVRSSWLFGAGGRNFVEELLAATEGVDRVPADAETVSSPTYTVHLAVALAALVRRAAYGIFHLAADGSCTQFQFARTLYRAASLACQPVPIVGDEETAAAGGGRKLVLGTRRTEVPKLPDWRIGLNAYLQERMQLGKPTRPRTA